MTQYTPDSLLNRKEAAEFLGVVPHTLEVWATTKRYNLPYIRIGRLVKYKYADLLTFVEQNRETQEQE